MPSGTRSTARLDDLLLVLLSAHREAVSAHLEAIISSSKRAGQVMEALVKPLSRKRLAARTKIDSTNLAKVTGPLVRGGWIVETETESGLTYERGAVVSALLEGTSVAAWRKARVRRSAK